MKIVQGDDEVNILNYAFDSEDLDIRAGGGADLVLAGIGNDIIDGGSGNDEIAANFGNDSIQGGANDDLIRGGAGFDTLDGGTGTDTIQYGDAISYYDMVIINGVFSINHTRDVLGVSDGADEGVNCEFVTFNDFFGSTVKETYKILDLVRSGRIEYILEGRSNGDDVINGSALPETILGLGGNDSLYGNTGDDKIDGGEGNDILEGGGGNDVLSGNDGNDSLKGGIGNDIVVGGEGTDTAIYDGNFADYDITKGENGIIVVDALAGHDGMDTLKDIEKIQFKDKLLNVAIGGENTAPVANDDKAYMSAIKTILVDVKANDFDPDGNTFNITNILQVEKGSATIENGQIRFNYYPDAIIPYGSHETIEVVYEVTDSFGGTDQAVIEIDVTRFNGPDISGNANRNILRGTSADEFIRGLGGRDEISAGAGNDRIDGGKGKDVLAGGEGSDEFVFRKGSGPDVITDFQATAFYPDKADILDLSSFSQIDDWRSFLLSHSKNDGGDLVITLNAFDSITLEDTRRGDLSESSFLL